jgi:DNA-binding MarR family transcriptional regulator
LLYGAYGTGFFMDRGELNELRLMGEIERNGEMSQRELARRMNLSLGLINTFLKRLVSKGYFKVTTMPRNRVKYFLTPSGIARKSRLTVEYLRYSVNFYREIKSLLIGTYARLQEKGVRTVLFFGSGEVAELAYLYLKTTNLVLAGIVDDNRKGRSFFEFDIKGTDVFSDLKWDALIVTRAGADSDIDFLTACGVPRDRIVLL